jgi:hypothetical protein
MVLSKKVSGLRKHVLKKHVLKKHVLKSTSVSWILLEYIIKWL